MAGLRLLWPLCLGLTFCAGCSELTAPRDERVTPLPEPRPAPVARPPAEAPAAQAPPPAPPPSPEVAHVLVAYKGAKGAPTKTTRTKEQARKLADDVAKRAGKEDFGALAKRMSDDAATASKGGSIGALAPSAPKPLYDAASSLAPGGVSTVVETEEGFHVLKRPGAPPAPSAAPKGPPHPGAAPPPPRPSPPARPTNAPPRPRAPGGQH